MNLDGYEARVLGRDLYLALAKKHNLTTQKWTLGRLKEFKNDVKYHMKNKIVK